MGGRPGGLDKYTFNVALRPRNIVSLSFASGTENPVSQNGIWTHGGATGLDWNNMQLTSGILCGTQAANSFDGHYADSGALLTGYGTWRADQEVEAVVKSTNQQTGSNYCEVEIRLRCQITAHSFTGYEILWRCNHDGSQYHQIGYWYGPIGVAGVCTTGCAFDGVPNSIHPTVNGMEAADGFGGIYDGDTVGARIIGNRITTWIIGGATNPLGNGVKQVLEDFNDTGGAGGGAYFTSGYPGLGHWNHSTSASPTDYGFTSAVIREL
jgi:hypothetical protein